MSTIQNASSLSAFLSAASSTSTTANGSASSISTPSASDIQNQFLSMLVAQLQNQDPLNPMDNSQVTSQMAQLSTVQGITNLNNTMQAMSNSLGASQMTQAANLIGHGVLVPGNSVSPTAGYNVIGMNLPSAADNVVVTIHNSSGQTVRTMNLGAQSSGDQTFSWDGMTDGGNQAPSGAYQFSISATQGGNPVTATSVSSGQVTGVLLNGTNIQLQVDSVGAVNYTDVHQII
ncbi:MAG: flagellar hook assembly protein FlgD [Thiobacillaceae bacterium]